MRLRLRLRLRLGSSLSLGISIGKLSLYIAAAGIHPRATIPIVVDLGTNTKKYLEDPLYLGLRRQRPGTDEYVEVGKLLADGMLNSWSSGSVRAR